MSDHKRNLNGIEPSEMDLHYKAHPLFWVLISSLHSYLWSHCLSKNAKSFKSSLYCATNSLQIKRCKRWFSLIWVKLECISSILYARSSQCTNKQVFIIRYTLAKNMLTPPNFWRCYNSILLLLQPLVFLVTLGLKIVPYPVNIGKFNCCIGFVTNLGWTCQRLTLLGWICNRKRWLKDGAKPDRLLTEIIEFYAYNQAYVIYTSCQVQENLYS